MTDLAGTLIRLGQYPEGEKVQREALEIQRRVFGPNHPETAGSMYNFPCLAAHQGHRDEALALLGQAIDRGLAPNVAMAIEKDDDLQELHGDPRFHAIVAHSRYAGFCEDEWSLRSTLNLSRVTQALALWHGLPAPLSRRLRHAATIPAYSEPGAWTVDWIYVKDNVGNDHYYYPADLQALGFPTAFQFGASTSVALTSSANPATYGQAVTFTATVTSSSGNTPIGSVNFNDGSTTLGTGTLDANGVATFTTSSLSLGSHSVVAAYPGDTNFVPANSSPLSQQVNQASATLALASSASPSSFNEPVTLTATVTPQYSGSATGNVTFYDGTIALGTVAVSGNEASFSTSGLTVGSHSLTAAYSGDTNFTGSTSAVLSQTVNKATSTTGVVSSLNPSLVSQTVTFTATVSGQYGGTPTGTVTFKQGATILGTVALSNGQASYSVTYTTNGTRSITATHSGDGNFLGSTSATLSQVVNKVSTTTAITSSSNPSSVKLAVTFTATVTSTNTSLALSSPSGTVTFRNGSTTLGTGTLSGGVATFTTSSLPAGTQLITATYGGDTNYTGSVSPKLSQVVSGMATTTAVSSSLNPSSYGQSVTFTATVAPTSGTGVPTGSVTFKSGTTTLAKVTLVSGAASYSTTALTVGMKSITEVYSGDSTYTTSTSAALSQVINKATTTTTLTSSQNPSTSGQLVTFTATASPQYSGTPTGSVTFKLGTTPLATVTMSNGVATYTTSTLPSGSDTIQATYNGSSQFSSSTNSLVQMVN